MSSELSISRVLRPRNAAKTTYNRYGFLYDLIGGQFERSYALTGLGMLNIQPGEQVLEVGFGTGHALVALAKAVGDHGKVVGIDISERMCAMSWRRINRSGLSNRVSLYCGDAIKLPFNDDEFDAIFMSFTLELFDTPDISRVLTELKRVLKPKGRLCVVSLSKSQREPCIERLYEWVHRHFPDWVDCRPINPIRALSRVKFTILQAKLQPMFGLNVAMVLASELDK